MTTEEEDARRERADRLREQIREKTSTTPKRPEEPRKGESPREFIERRMRETEKDPGGKR